jgi:O-methyltransferase
MKRIGSIVNAARNRGNPSADLRLYVKYRDYTMIPQPQFVDRLALARTVEADGDVVECGTWKGGMIAALSEDSGRRAVLFDSFEGLPEPQLVDGAAALAWRRDRDSTSYYNNCTADESDAIAAMTLAGVDYDVRKGWFDQTVPEYAAERPTVAIVHLDGDWYESILTCLEHLYPIVSPGGLILIDDYGLWDGCTRAVHHYLARTEAAEDLRRSDSGVTFLRKR